MPQSSPESKQKWLDANQHKRPTINRHCRLRTFYGISPEEYDEMLIRQNNKCPICERVFNSETGIEPHLDHDHSSGWVRGVICSACNLGIGSFSDDTARLEKAIEYLIENATPTEFNIFQARANLKKKTTGNKQPRTEEQKELLRVLALGRTPWNKGLPWNGETKEKMSEAAIKRFSDPKQRKLASEYGQKGAALRWGK